MQLLLIVFIIGLLHIAAVNAATRVDAKRYLQERLQQLGGQSHRAKRQARRLAVRDLLGTGPETQLEVTDTSRNAQGMLLVKMEERYKGRQVFDTQITVETDPVEQEIVDITGSFVKDIEDDTGGQPSIYPNQALNAVLQEFGDSRHQATDIRIEIKIFLDENSQAFPGYFVQYLVENDRRPRRPTAIVDGRDGRVTMKWNSLTTLCSDAQGYGGNEKVGRRVYDGMQFPCLAVTKVGDTCELQNHWVKVINMGGMTFYNITEAMTYDCQAANDTINGAYSPALDAFFIGTQIAKMYSEWYNISAVKNSKLIFRVHYGINYTNAFWNGVNCTFGDSMGFLFPFVSPDTVGHEVGHALIEQNSGLLWYQEPGALNEAFADITGEVIEHYITGHDWKVGMDIVRGEDAFRYFDEPERNFFSISNAQNFEDYMGPHESGGVLAHAFYLLVENHGLEMKEVYRVFLHANQMYWHQMSTFKSGVCELMRSVYDLGQNGAIYKEVFERVGIQVCNAEDQVVGLRNNKTYDGIQLSNTVHPVFTFGLPGEWTATFWVKASSQHGDVHITVSNQTWLQAYEPEASGILVEGYSSVTYTVTNRRLYHVTITLSSDLPDLWADVTLEAGYLCLEANQTSHGYFEYLRGEFCPK